MIELYTRENCSFCAKAKELLDIEKISYTNYNITAGEADRAQILQRIFKGGPQQAIVLPVVFIDDKYIGGFNELSEYLASVAIEKQVLVEALKNSVLLLNFTKADGTIREMKATLQSKYINHPAVDVATDQASRQYNVIPVFDIEKNEWRSFRLDRLNSWKQVESA